MKKNYKMTKSKGSFGGVFIVCLHMWEVSHLCAKGGEKFSSRQAH